MSFDCSLINMLFAELNKINKDGTIESILSFRDNLGYLPSKEEGLRLKQRLLKDLEKVDAFYKMENVDDLINEHNFKMVFRQYMFEYDEEKGVHLFKEPTYDKRKPKLKYRDSWSFTCQWCGKKWSTKEKEYYYRAYFEVNGYRENGETVCSKECAVNASIDAQKTWISINGYSEFFIK